MAATGRGRMRHASDRLAAWREAVTLRAREATARDRDWPTAAAVSVDLAFTLPRPRRTTRVRPVGPPDVDKLARACLDGLTAGGIYRDDAQVIDLHARKRYGAPAGVTITARILDDEEHGHGPSPSTSTSPPPGADA